MNEKEKSDTITLNQISTQIPRGSLVAIVGRVGTGKSSLLAALLGDIDRVSGTVNVDCGSVAYVSQQPWIQNRTIKENVLFGSDLDDQWYQETMVSCALKDDLKQLSDGDSTLIGENGINLSGGQKQRVSIARAVYKKADLYLLDDPLSALDSGTSNHVFEHVISNRGLLRGTTRILVTHRTNVVNQADYVMVMKGGKISDFGPPNKMLNAANSELSLLMGEMGAVNAFEENGEMKENSVDEEEEKTRGDLLEAKNEDTDTNVAKMSKDQAEAVARRMKDEEVLTGRVNPKAYQRFFKALGYMSSIISVTSFVVNQAVSTGSSIWLATWSDHTGSIIQNGTGTSRSILSDNLDNDFYLGVYGVFGAGQAMASFFRNLFFFWICANGSISIHKTLFDAVIHAKIRFFDVTPTGSVINRFSGDLHMIDAPIPGTLSGFLFTFTELVSAIIVIAISSPLFLVFVLPLALIYWAILHMFIPTSRQVQRFQSSSRSPVNHHFSETISGVSTVRAFGAQEWFKVEFQNRIEANLRNLYVSKMLMRWLCLRSEFIGSLVVLLAAVLAVWQRGDMTAGWAGLTISYAMSVTETFNFVLINFSQLEENAVSIERIRETEKHAPREGEWSNPAVDPKEKNWLQKGSLEFCDVTMSYADDLPNVLRGLSLRIQGGEKIGICGRTGAGKSSIAVTIFNLIDSRTGDIRLDGIETKNLGLHTLRSNLTVIPQVKS